MYIYDNSPKPSFAPVGKQTTDRGQDFYSVVKGMTKISCYLKEGGRGKGEE